MFTKTAAVFALTLALSLTAYADFSYSRTQKATGGSMAAMAGTAANSAGRGYFKGEKSVMTSGDISTVIDFGAQTITTINNAQKTYKIQKFSDIAAAGATTGANVDVKADVKQTGQKKTINGFNASETLVTMDTSIDMGRGAAMQMQVEVSIWTSSEVPGAKEMHDYYMKHSANMPWAAMMGGGAAGPQGMQKAIGQLQKKLSELDGMPVEEVIRVKPAGSAAGAPQVAQMPQMTAAQQAQMAAAMQKMQDMSKQGGAQGAAAAQAMARMGGMPGMGAAPAAGGASTSLIELTVENTDFSTAEVPDSVFAIPAGFKQIQ